MGRTTKARTVRRNSDEFKLKVVAQAALEDVRTQDVAEVIPSGRRGN
jgi:hypothetical protein